MPTTVVNRPNTNLSERDFNLLAKLTEAEAGGEGYAGKVAVAASVLNRVKSGDYPNTVRNVIFDRGQYSPVDDRRLYDVNPNQETINAVRDALNGADPTNGATVFWNPTKAPGNSWLNSRPKTKKIGNHQFARHK
ncbi:cell wall hydrolase [Metabacillus sp. Hm71]|uniref:cell wall hydrolase n=1 Tax=Metabacillus sp. Hm71 TaxID=3450743 RepID=UPI003F422CC4